MARLSPILTPERIFPRLGSSGREGAIAEMVGGLRDRLPGARWDGVEKALVKREHMGSTAIGEGIAIPHARWEGDFLAAFGVSAEGVEFDSLDGKRVHLIVMVLSPAGRAGDHLKCMAAISRLTGREGFREEIKRASDPAEILSIIRAEEVRVFRNDS